MHRRIPRPDRVRYASARSDWPRHKRKIDETRTRHVGADDEIIGAEFFRDRLGKIARLLAGILGQHHRRIGGDITVRRVARRLDRHARLIEAGRQCACGDQRIGRAVDAREKLGEDAFCNHERAARLTQFGGRVKEPAMLGERVAVGHAGYEIGDASRPRDVVEAGEPCHSSGKSPECAL